MSQQTQTLSLNFLSKLKWWQATIMIVSILLSAGWAASQGAHINVDVTLQGQIQAIENRLDIPVNSTLSAFIKSNSFIVSQLDQGFCLQNGTNGAYLPPFTTNSSAVIQNGLGNATINGGSVYVAAGQNLYNASVILQNNTRLVIESGAQNVTYSCASGAYGVVDDFQNWIFTYYSNGTAYSIFNYATGTLSFPGTGTFGNVVSTEPNSPYTFTVYIDPNNSSLYDGKAANGTICWSSTNASQVINNAVNNGSTFARDGLYDITNPIIITKNGTSLTGNSWNTNLQRDPAMWDSIIWVGCNSTSLSTECRVDNVFISTLQLDGNLGAGIGGSTVNEKGICFHSGAVTGKTWANLTLFGYNNTAHNVWAHHCSAEGISFDYQINARALYCKAENNSWPGTFADMAIYFSRSCFVESCITSSGYYGYNFDGLEYSQITNCVSMNHPLTVSGFGLHMFTTTSTYPAQGNIVNAFKSVGDYIPFDIASSIAGVSNGNDTIENSMFLNAGTTSYLTRVNICTVQSNQFIQGNGTGLTLWGSWENNVQGNTFYDESATTGSGCYDIKIFCINQEFNSTGNTIKNNKCYSDITNKPSNCIYIGDTNSSGNFIEENDFENFTSPISDAALNSTRISNNAGYNPKGKISSPISGNGGAFFCDAGNNATFVSTTVYNNTESPKVLYMSGGTVTVVAVDGMTLYTTAGSYTIYLGYGDTLSITFSSAPTITVYGE
jgi:parallel beta-helix repeat protein